MDRPLTDAQVESHTLAWELTDDRREDRRRRARRWYWGRKCPPRTPPSPRYVIIAREGSTPPRGSA